MSKAIEIQAPNKWVKLDNHITVFLAGSIEMGKAIEWQKNVIEQLKDEPIIFLNPRRDDWDSSWEQKKTNPQFKEQVTWEIMGLEAADVILMYFDPNTKSPISLLELGIHAKSDKLIVLCPEPFWRKGNVDIVCDLYDIKQVESIDDFVTELKKKTKK
jgi:hypothetical protein